MLVSAISMCENIECIKNETQPFRYNKQTDFTADTSFNSLAPSKKISTFEKNEQMYNNINEWQNFCHDRILGKKLNIIA